MKKWIMAAMLLILVGAAMYTVKSNENKLINKPDTNINVSTDTPSDKTQGDGSTASQGNKIQINPNSIKVNAIDFKLKDLNGKEISLSQFKGKKVFLNFWATWCPPCRGEMPEIEQVYNETKNSDLVILAVNIGESQSTVKAFMEKNKYNFTVLLDSTQETAAQYNINSIPTSFFIDSDSNIAEKRIGAMDKAQMEAYIKELDKK